LVAHEKFCALNCAVVVSRLLIAIFLAAVSVAVSVGVVDPVVVLPVFCAKIGVTDNSHDTNNTIEKRVSNFIANT